MTKEVMAILKRDKKNPKIYLEFIFDDDNLSICLEETENVKIKEVFSRIAYELCNSDISVKFKIDSTIKEGSDKLFIDASEEYIRQLNLEIEALIRQDENLKKIRKEINEPTPEIK